MKFPIISFFSLSVFLLIVDTGNTSNSLHSKDSFQQPADSNSINKSKYQISMGYWNDNFLISKLMGEKIKQGNDDFVTASLWLQYAAEVSKQLFIVDVYYNILTNKSDNYRTDLLTTRFTLERHFLGGMVQAGPGIIARGNFGGSDIQNTYHALLGNKKLRLPYTGKNEIGGIFYIKYKPLIWHNDMFQVKGYTSNSYRSKAGPCNFGAGIEMNGFISSRKKPHIILIQTHTGYINYYKAGNDISSLFDNGFTWGVLFSGWCSKRIGGSFWITGNQYGMKQPHFGISINIGWYGKRMTDLSDITFP